MENWDESVALAGVEPGAEVLDCPCGFGRHAPLVRADYRSLPFASASFDCALNLFTSLGYLGRDGDIQVLAELRRVLRPGGALLLETMHRDRLARIFAPRRWDPLPDGSFFLQEREYDWATETVATRHLIVGNGDPVERRFVLHAYTVTERVAIARESGFEEVECFSDWTATSPPTPEARLIVRAR